LTSSIRVFLSLLLILCFESTLHAQTKLSAQEAKSHIGETATVCGTVASARYAVSTKGQPTFLNLDKPYPDQVFTIVIWGTSRSKFRSPEVTFKGKRICVTGQIAEFKGMPEIVASSPIQIKTE
jgi:DNA/RNA endonuclease YhcR with UshA esterase domain